MSKRYSNRDFDSFDSEDDGYRNGYRDHLLERRKLKKLKSAIKSKNIDYLLDLEEYE